MMFEVNWNINLLRNRNLVRKYQVHSTCVQYFGPTSPIAVHDSRISKKHDYSIFLLY